MIHPIKTGIVALIFFISIDLCAAYPLEIPDIKITSNEAPVNFIHHDIHFAGSDVLKPRKITLIRYFHKTDNVIRLDNQTSALHLLNPQIRHASDNHTLTVYPVANHPFFIESHQQASTQSDCEKETNGVFIFSPYARDLTQTKTTDDIIFGPGEHFLQDPITAQSGQTIRFDPEAIVHGRIVIENTSHINITGGGILIGDPNAPAISIVGDGAHEISINNIAIISNNAAAIHSNAPETKINHVTIVCLGLKGNGIETGTNGLVTNCLIKSTGDAIRLTHSGTRVEHTSIWQMENGAPFMMGHPFTEDQKGLRVSNCRIVKCEQQWDNQGLALFAARHKGKGELTDITFENIIAHNTDWRLADIQTLPTQTLTDTIIPGNISHVRFRNISVNTSNNQPFKRLSVINGCHFGSLVSNITFENNQVNGIPIDSQNTKMFYISSLSSRDISFSSSKTDKTKTIQKKPAKSAKQWTNPITNGLNTYGNKDFNIFYENNTYYLTATEQNNPQWSKRGVILYESADMINWRESAVLINRANLPSDKWYLDEWRAPKITKINAKYYLTFNGRNNTLRPYSKTGMGLAVADKLTGPYSVLSGDKPITEANNSFLMADNQGKTMVFWDMDGYIYTSQIDLEKARLKGDIIEVVSPATMGSDFHFSDAPFVMQDKGKYIMLFTQFYGGYVIRVRQMMADNPAGPWKLNDTGELLSFTEAEADERLKMPYSQGYTFAPPTQVVFHHALFKGSNDQLYMSWHTSEKYSEPYLWIAPASIIDHKVVLDQPKSSHPSITDK